MNKNIKQAYDEMNPSPDAEDRMLESILAAYDEKASLAEDADPKIHAFEDLPSKRKKTSKRSLPLALAACLLILAGVGIYAGVSASNTRELSSGMVESKSSGENIGSSAEESGSIPLEIQEEINNNPSESYDEAPAYDMEAPSSSIESMSSGSEYPLIDTKDIGQLRIQENSRKMRSSQLEGIIGPEISQATARTLDGTNSIACTVFEYLSSNDDLYLVQYEGENGYYFAEPE